MKDFFKDIYNFGKAVVQKVFKGDRTLWFITILLFLFSLVTVFSSTTLTDEVLSGKSDRWELFYSQVKSAGAFFILIVLGINILDFCNKKDINLLKKLSFYSFWLAFGLCVCLRCGLFTDSRLPDRALSVLGLQLNVAEVLKFLLILPLVYFGIKYKNNITTSYDKLSGKFPSFEKWWAIPFVRRFFLLYLPAVACIALIVHGAFSSSLFLVVISYIVFAFSIEKTPRRNLFVIGLFFTILLFVGLRLLPYSAVHNHGRLETAKARTMYFLGHDNLDSLNKNSDSYKEMLSYIRQIEGAKKAIKEGGVFGVGAGQSKQKYKVAAIHNDYLFSFICEEYGIFGGIVTILVFLLIYMRCRYLSHFLEDEFEKNLLNVFGFLITLQAFMHIAVNLNVVPMTGQALPLLSSGTSALATFSAIICVILFLSHKAIQTKNQENDENNN